MIIFKIKIIKISDNLKVFIGYVKNNDNILMLNYFRYYNDK